MNKVKLKDIAQVVAGQSPKSIYYNTEMKGLPFLQGNRTFGNLFPYIDTWTTKVTKKAKKGDVLISVRAPVGDLNLCETDLCIGRGLAAISSEKYPNRFIYYSLKYNINSLISSSTGTTFSSINKNDLESLDLIIPEENQISNVTNLLSVLDDKIELNNTINAELEAMAKTLYDYWFVQFEFPNSEGKPYKSSGGAMEYNPTLKREIPKGWEVKTIGDYCKSTGGFAFKSSWWTNEGEAVIKIKDIQEDYTINLDDLSYVDLSDKIVDDKFKAKPGDVLIAMTGATIGKYAIIPITEKPLYVNQRVGYFNLGEKPIFKLPFFINSLNQSYFRETVFALASGAAQPNISNEQINNISLLFPEEEFIKMYNSKLYGCYKRILLNLKQNQELAQLRDWLLPMLMNGQVKVVDAEEQAMSIAAEPNITYAKRSEKNKDDSKEERFRLWLSNQKLAARGDVDEDTLRKLFDAMEEDEL